ncbi:hypothetical protein ACJIZ3_004228 [Penstemon smallii]|uniref:Growth-regulating factor n=1 Tax=Penstemon smallii TaxID=265156 RepID=A0ABD3S1N5_9LAMI
MSGTSSTSVAVGMSVGVGGEVGYGAPFTAMQWQELEHQAMIYKYLVAGLPVPPDLVMPIRRSFEALSARFFPHPSLGYCSYYGKKFDPEPGRCRRTDGKKWRCSKDAHPESKYCERHMHRGRNRSRKPVESQSTSQSVSTAMSQKNPTVCSNNSGSFPNIPLYSVLSSEGSSFGSNVTKLQMEPVSYGIDNKEFRYIQGPTPDDGNHNFSLEASGTVGNLSLLSSAENRTWNFTPYQVSSSSFLKQKSDSQLLGVTRAFEHIDSTISKHQQHCFFGSEIGSPGTAKQEQNLVHPFFSEWPSTKESWSNLDDDDGPSKNVFSSTQLSISTPRASSSRSAYSPPSGES